MDVTNLFENIYLHIAEFTKHEHTTIYLDIKSTKKQAPNLQNVALTNDSKKLPNHERNFNVCLQYIK